MLPMWLHRRIRYEPITERAVNMLKRSARINFKELNYSLPAGPGDIIIDCGANVGDLTSRFARTGATVHSFEPNPICFSILSRRFAGISNVICHHKGVMDKAGTLKLEVPVGKSKADALNLTVLSTFQKNDLNLNVNTVDIECVDLAEFIDSLGKPIKVLKIDIEGAEVAVLNHLLDRGTLGKVEFAAVETHERFSDELARGVETLRQRIQAMGLSQRVRLDWV